MGRNLPNKPKKLTLMYSEATIMVIIFGEFLMFYQIFLSPQVKQRAIIINKHGT